MEQKRQTPETVWAEYEKGVDFKNQLNLYDTVRSNEDFYIGKQWEGVQSNGLPTPVFNFIKADHSVSGLPQRLPTTSR